MLGVLTDARLFNELISQKIPKLSAHMQKLNVDIQPIIVRWFLCLFVNVFPLEVLTNEWKENFISLMVFF